MKGVQGILISIGLGVAGAVCNWFYLERLAGREAKVSFIGIKADAQINVGDILREDQLIKVDIPRSAVGNLDQVAPLWGIKSTVAGQKTSRSFRGGELVMMDDLRTTSAKNLNEKLGKNEVAIWFPVESRSFNTAQVNPDDEISFVLPRHGLGGASPTPLSNPVDSQGNSEIVGPFRILSLGNRASSMEVQKAAGGRQGNENSIAVVAKYENGHLDAKTERVSEYMRATKAQGLQVILHQKKKPGE